MHASFESSENRSSSEALLLNARTLRTTNPVGRLCSCRYLPVSGFVPGKTKHTPHHAGRQRTTRRFGQVLSLLHRSIAKGLGRQRLGPLFQDPTAILQKEWGHLVTGSVRPSHVGARLSKGHLGRASAPREPDCRMVKLRQCNTLKNCREDLRSPGSGAHSLKGA